MLTISPCGREAGSCPLPRLLGGSLRAHMWLDLVMGDLFLTFVRLVGWRDRVLAPHTS